jgi:predicted PurR-regulated permease PerM
MHNNGSRRSKTRRRGDRTRRRVRLAALVGLTVLGLVLCGFLAYPFLPALAWAVALAVMAFPIHARLEKVIPGANWAAGVSTAVVVAVILVPILLVAEQLGHETAEVAAKAGALAREGRIEVTVAKLPYGPEALTWVKQNLDMDAEARHALTQLFGSAAVLARGSAWFAIQTIVCVFVLFFAFRDWRHLLNALEDLSPLSRAESDYLFTRVSDSIHATVYATVVTSVIQGATGGLLFWALGLPTPVLWGVVMTVLGILPLVGAFFVWFPAAAVLALDDRWGAAIALVVWGLLMAGPVGDWLYTYFANGRMRLHPVPVLLAFVGGLAVFGVSGMVLGPVALAVTMGLIDVWRQRLRSAPADRTEPALEGAAVAPADVTQFDSPQRT